MFFKNPRNLANCVKNHKKTQHKRQINPTGLAVGRIFTHIRHERPFRLGTDVKSRRSHERGADCGPPYLICRKGEENE